MDAAVSLVQTYLRVNGYFTVTEFPVVEHVSELDFRTATDLDLLACRFPSPSTAVVGEPPNDPGRRLGAPDPLLEIPEGSVDMIVGEVKESVAEFNPGGMRPDVLAAALARFGCCRPGAHAEKLVRTLLSRGRAETGHGHLVRLVAFGARTDARGPYLQVSLDRVVKHLEAYVHDNWSVLRHTQSKDPALAFQMIREKARRASRSAK